MSKVAKRKHLMNEAIWDDYYLPSENQSIVKVEKSLGKNLHEVITPQGESYIASMPNKFRNIIWIKRGDYILVEPIPENAENVEKKVKAEIVKILNKNSIKYYKENNIWPTEFHVTTKTITDYNNDDYLMPNPNRINFPVHYHESDDSSSSSDSSEDEDSSSSDNESSGCEETKPISR